MFATRLLLIGLQWLGWGMLSCCVVVAQERPNILWVTSEDNGPALGCYGDTYAETPNLDAFAARSLRFQRCWSNAPVCAPARTTIVSGMYSSSLGAHHMRSGVILPAGMQLYPALMREAGYYCTNNSKTDYNFADPDAGWHESNNKAHWRSRPDDATPFFAIFNFTTSHESQIRKRPHTAQHDPAKAPLPAYHPDTPEVRQDWAQYYDKMTEMDQQVGKVLNDLEADGLADSTIVFYYGDHGSGMPRSKRWPFDSGLRVPLIVHFPAKFQHLAPQDYAAGGESTRLVEFADLAPTLLSLVGVESPENMQGVPFAGKFEGDAHQIIYGFRGRMDERIDMVRSCTDGRYVYMRHFFPDRPYLKHVNYMFETPTTRVWKERFDAGQLNAAQAKFWGNKPTEELFDLQSDPDEVNNIADRPEHTERVAQMRDRVRAWMIETGDLGVLPEAEMLRLSGKRAPRELITSGELPLQAIVELAFDAIDNDSDLTIEGLTQRAEDSESGIRYWAIRGLDRRLRAGATGADRQLALDVLEQALMDESPSVGIAAADGLLATGEAGLSQQAAERLLYLANVNEVGSLAPVAALNVVDIYRGQFDDSLLGRFLKLPREERNAPPRVGGYVSRLLDYLSQSTASQ